jgi:hypothetical protein
MLTKLHNKSYSPILKSYQILGCYTPGTVVNGISYLSVMHLHYITLHKPNASNQWVKHRTNELAQVVLNEL